MLIHLWKRHSLLLNLIRCWALLGISPNLLLQLRLVKHTSVCFIFEYNRRFFVECWQRHIGDAHSRFSTAAGLVKQLVLLLLKVIQCNEQVVVPAHVSPLDCEVIHDVAIIWAHKWLFSVYELLQAGFAGGVLTGHQVRLAVLCVERVLTDKTLQVWCLIHR